MSAPKVRSPLLKSLYNHNPFYAISTVLMLFAVRNAYGELRIGAINCWMMMGVLAGYTALLAGIGILIVRKGKVWEDARSIPVLLIILFLAVSISADDLFVKMESTTAGGLLLLCGYIFTAVITEAFLVGTKIRLPALYRVPLHLFLALFYIAPWWCSPELHPRSIAALEWTLFSFPVTAAAMILLLLPAVRRGPGYATENGTPWRWPWFPWTAFGVIIGMVALRTFTLCMTYGPSGPIWIDLARGRQSISYDTMWGPYFLIPPAFAVLVLLLEAGLVTGNRRLVRRVMYWTPALLLLALPFSHGSVFREFLGTFTETVGAPLWLTVWLQLAFFTWSGFRRAPGAGFAALATLGLFAFIGPDTIDFESPPVPRAWPFLVMGAVLLPAGIKAQSTRMMAAACGLLTLAVWMYLPETSLHNYRLSISYHLLWAGIVILGVACRDRFAEVLRIVGAAQVPLASLIVLAGPHAEQVPMNWRLAYVIGLAVVCFAIATLGRSRWYLYAFGVQLAMAGYAATVTGFRGTVSVLGKAATTSFAWSLAALIMAILISAHKADWLPQRMFQWMGNGNGGDEPPTDLPSAIIEPPDPPEEGEG